MLLAINRNLIGKVPADVLAQHNHAFEAVDISIDELATAVNRGYAFCPQFNTGKRRSANFKVAGYLAVDVDQGMDIDTAMASPFFQNYASLLYTTASHLPDAHRFRIVFELDIPITDGEKMKAALTGLISRFGGDKSCTDACRLFFGAADCQTIRHGKTLPASVVEELILRGEESAIRTDNRNDRHAPAITVASRLQIPIDAEVQTERGEWRRLDVLPERTRVHCPNHVDNRPSAFTLRSTQGVPGIHCKSCNATFFLAQPEQKPYRYDFDYSWRRITDISYEEYTAYANGKGLVSVSDVRGGVIRQLDVKYLPYDEAAVVTQAVPSNNPVNLDITSERFLPEYDVTFIKSPKGSGKTEWLQKLVERHKAAGNSILLIGHRRTLINATAQRLGLVSYLKMSGSGDGDESMAEIVQEGYNEPRPHYAICLDSMVARLDPRHHHYDLVVIDEVEQVFSHLLSRTLRDSRKKTILHLRHYLIQAKARFLLDADLNRVTVEVLNEFLGEKEVDWQALVNQPTPLNRVLHLYGGKQKTGLTGELVAALNRHERCFVTTNSLTWTEGLAEQMAKATGRSLKSIVVNSKTSKSPEVQRFLAHIREEAPKYDLIIASPSMGTGIDITFDDDAQLIDTVFGFFETRVNTHFDIDQQLARVRNPKRINVWISPDTFNFETDPNAIAAEIRAMDDEFREYVDIRPDGEKVYAPQDIAGMLYEQIYASVSASRRASINNLRQNFIELRESNGWTIELVEPCKEIVATGREVHKQKAAADEERRIVRLLAARQLHLDEYRLLKKKQEDRRSDTERDEIDRYELEAFYCRDATAELIQEDENWKLRRAIRNFQMLATGDAELADQERGYKYDPFQDRGNRILKKKLLVELMSAAGIYNEGKFLTEVELSMPMLRAFAQSCVGRKADIENLWNVAVRSDVFKKPIQQLQAIVEPLGLVVKKSRTDQAGGKKTYFYRLDENSLKQVKGWADELTDPEIKKAWEASRDFDAIHRGLEAIERRKASKAELAT